MTGGDVWVATTRQKLPELGSRGLIAPWTGMALAQGGSAVFTSAEEAAAVALGVAEDADSAAVLKVDVPAGTDGTVIIWSAAKEIHLASERAKNELLARAFDNFNPAEIPVVVSQTVFPAVRPPPVSASPAPPPPARLAGADLLVGAAAAVAAVPVGTQRTATRDGIASGILGEAAEAIPVDGLLEACAPLIGGTEPDQTALLRSALTRITGGLPGGPVGARTLITELVGETDSASAVYAPLQGALEVLRQERDLPVFTEGRGIPAVRGLLLFLLRPEPVDTVTWIEEIPEDPMSVVLAAAIAGLHSGWTRLPVALRGPVSWRTRLEGVLYRAATGEISPWDRSSPAPALNSSAEEPGSDSIAAEGEVVTGGPLHAFGEPTTSGLDDDSQPQLGLGLQVQTGQNTAVHEGTPATTLQFVLSALTIERLAEPAVAEAAAKLCARLKLDDYVTTRLVPNRRRFLWTGTAIESSGYSPVEYSVDTALLDHLRTEECGNVSELRLLAEALGAPKKAARKRPSK